MMNTQYLYWMPPNDFERVKPLLKSAGFKLSAARLTPCQVMKAEADRVIYAPPAVWSRMCTRQSTWYHESRKQGQLMLMSGRRLPRELDSFLDAELSVSDFVPERLPTLDELQETVDSDAYQSRKPKGWEAINLMDAVMMKILFTVKRFWGRGDTLKSKWLAQRANHANFLARRFTTNVDGEDVPYSVTGNEGVCSSCAEFFNVVEDATRKLVRSCPGAIIFGDAPRDVYVDVKPVSIEV